MIDWEEVKTMMIDLEKVIIRKKGIGHLFINKIDSASVIRSLKIIINYKFIQQFR